MRLKSRVTRLESFRDLNDRVAIITLETDGRHTYHGREYADPDEIDTGGRVKFIMPRQYETPEAWEAAQQITNY
jgi:hypothetical protein